MKSSNDCEERAELNDHPYNRFVENVCVTSFVPIATDKMSPRHHGKFDEYDITLFFYEKLVIRNRGLRWQKN